MKKYVNIERAKALYLNNLEVGESIVIEEKIAGGLTMKYVKKMI